MDLNEDQLLEVAFDSAISRVGEMPPGVWGHIAKTATSGAGRRQAQHPGWSGSSAATLNPLSAFIDTAAEFGLLIDTLSEADWAQRTRVEGTVVRDLVEHLVGMERYLLGQLDRRPRLSADRREDHWPATTAAAADIGDEANDVVAHMWWTEVLDLIAACAELGPDHPVRYHHLAGSVRSLLVSRTFELWTHGDDIRQAVGRPLNLLDEARLSLMVSELMSALPIGVALTGDVLPGRTARFNVTGAGGGTFDVPLALSESPGAPDIVVTTDAIGLCRVAANRLPRGELECAVEGDHALLEVVLVAATAFAAD